MTRRELIKAVQDSVREALPELTQHDIATVVDAAFEQIATAMRDDGRYAHPGFGTFSVRRLAPRPGFNPRTGERIQVRASTSVRFSASRSLVERLGVARAPSDHADARDLESDLESD
ncbi:MAG: HU family DNA-binding protein [Myxococcales bacterium]|nr:HU family DNA-binding protein [Myxococcales bacterium]